MDLDPAELKARALEILRKSLDDPDATFHEHQWEAIETLVARRERLLVVQRTGWGKSAVYFVATRLLRESGRGPTLIISPLLALMRNQIESAARYGVALGTINSANTRDENESTINRVVNEKSLDALIVSPEQLGKPAFTEGVLDEIADNIGLFVIDEAHCISDWGHDFRPDYKRIINVLPYLPANMPVLATTATANHRVMDDVRSQLGKEIDVFRGKLGRDSLRLQTLTLPKPSQRLAWLADVIPTLPGTGIIYTATTRDAEVVASWLQHRGLDVEAYYGTIKGLSPDENRQRRLSLEDRLMNNELKALVATSALGMGYDKPDLAFVIHYQSTGSVVSYYQQVGRAGRAIPEARGVLLSGGEDDDIQQYFINQAFPRESLVKELLGVLEAADEPVSMTQLRAQVNGRPSKIDAALRFLLSEMPAPVAIAQPRPLAYARTVIDYDLPHAHIERLSGMKRQEWRTMQTYLEHDGCLMNFLLNELDDGESTPCGRCANCDPDAALPVDYSHDAGVAAAEFLERQVIEIQPRRITKAGGATASGLPYNLAKAGLAYEPGRAMTRWGDAGWGEIVASGRRKPAAGYDPRLAAVACAYIRERWKPEQAPAWITFVPSLRHPALVADFAEAMAEQLGLPCVDAIIKSSENAPQKDMANTEFKINNLDGVFTIASSIPDGPVLLVDDVVDSRWTLAVAAALLLKAGSGAVHPFALTSIMPAS